MCFVSEKVLHSVWKEASPKASEARHYWGALCSLLLWETPHAWWAKWSAFSLSDVHQHMIWCAQVSSLDPTHPAAVAMSYELSVLTLRTCSISDNMIDPAFSWLNWQLTLADLIILHKLMLELCGPVQTYYSLCWVIRSQVALSKVWMHPRCIDEAPEIWLPRPHSEVV